ncbi:MULTISPECIES: MarR family winged helix-turn-helix transcriptional regulator [Rhodococcus]|uniref:MarR family transcriptional regulator n=1 Tax=Rhodococcus aetherivorans TaxID=191292 RepID=A0AA46SC33_9NOCA|nr:MULTISPECIES: MarR family transcriptional regulator [Rhodococcus]MDV6297298.1 MarR family transcriptional regulator [Rhodococcus aetherivorans]TWH44391.1 DNA-binding MarR family transcriptional regulator [Rhodococcus rhodochrous J38]UYF97250.1 MarR family transcriptional regulator [Rhodococcus aetherivorans]
MQDSTNAPDHDPSDLNLLTSLDRAVDALTQRRPDTSPMAARLVLQLTRIADVMIYDIESRVHRPRGWSWSGFRVLFTLWTIGPLESRQITRITGMSRAGVSALIKTLERDGLVTRSRSETDRRTIEIELTEQGQTLVDEVLDEHHARERRWAGALTDDEQRQLSKLLDKLAGASDDLGVNVRE